MLFRHILFDGTQCTSGDTHALAVYADNLKVDVLATLGSDVGVATGVAEDGALSTQLTNAGHRCRAIDGKIMGVG